MKAPIAYYNEIDPPTAQWLRELIKRNLIAPGVVDERSILDVCPADLREFTQCHFFAGVGVWSYALRRAGWSDDRPIWTGSCPCQPFSVAGEGAGFSDERHLWPYWQWLIEQRKPAVVVGEQVASKAVDAWVDLVQADVEALGYAFGCAPFPSAGVGAPHIRDRAYWMAHASDIRLDWGRSSDTRDGRDEARIESRRLCDPDRMGDAGRQGLAQCIGQRGVSGEESGTGAGETVVGAGVCFSGLADGQRLRQTDIQCVSGSGLVGGQNVERTWAGFRLGGTVGRLADAEVTGRRERGADAKGGGERSAPEGLEQRSRDGGVQPFEQPGPTNGHWRDADWLLCRDGKWRPVEPGSSPLAHGAPARVGRLRGYGNAINAEAARVFIETVMECLP